jgi:glycosyltransferase involved in cell wall biosynthesis
MACVGCGAAPATVGLALGRPAQPRIACVMQLRNEERYLEGCLAHLRDHVDGVIALDDGSTDATPGMLEREPSLLACIRNPASGEHVWRERDNKLRLLQRARQLDFDWLLCCDADERYEQGFLENLRTIAGSFPADQLVCISVTLRELWNSPCQYRVDGVWGRKSRARFFRLPSVITFDDDQDLHGQWYPDQVRKGARMLRIRHALYHLKSIRREDRERRRDFYNRLDPERRFQAEGYDYLAEEGDDLRLETITPDRAYDYGSLPPEFSVIP